MGRGKKTLKEHALAIQKRYRELNAKEGFQTKEELDAYFFYRTPATQAALRKVLAHLEPNRHKTALELGSGPGSSYPVLKDLFFEKIVYIEKEQGFQREYPDVTWVIRDFLEDFIYPKADLVLFSYSLGELLAQEQLDAIQKAIDAMEKTIVIVEPGTPHGYETLMRARDFFIEKGLHINAPCFHTAQCPKKGPAGAIFRSGWNDQKCTGRSKGAL